MVFTKKVNGIGISRLTISFEINLAKISVSAAYLAFHQRLCKEHKINL